MIYGLAPFVLIIRWNSKYSNTLAESVLEIELHEGMPKYLNPMSFDGSVKIDSRNFDYVLFRENVHGYLERHGSAREYSPEQLANELLKYYLDKASK